MSLIYVCQTINITYHTKEHDINSNHNNNNNNNNNNTNKQLIMPEVACRTNGEGQDIVLPNQGKTVDQ